MIKHTRLTAGRGRLSYENTQADVDMTHRVYGRLVHISPRSFRMGEEMGWMSGLTVGFVAGAMFVCLALGLIG